jgi:predicted molibdopterin-dependent oxidoreductase YjgC
MDDLRMWLEPYSPDRVEHESGVQAGLLQRAAEILAGAQNPAILYGPDWVPGTAGNASLTATENLALLLGGEAGFVATDNNSLGALEMGVLPTQLPGGQPIDDGKARSRLTSFWAAKLSPVAGLDYEGMLSAGQQGHLKAMWVMGSDPAVHSHLARKVLGQIPFLVVQDLFMTETALLAEVVLPAASFAESDGSYTNLTGRWQAVRISKRPPADARPDWWIVMELARRMVGAKQKSAWEFSDPASVLGEITKVLGPKFAHYRGLDYDSIGLEGRQRPLPKKAARRSFLRVDSVAPSKDASYPLSLVPGHLLYDRGGFLRRSERLQNLVPDPFVMVHPIDAKNLNLTDGDEVLVASPHSELRLGLRISDEIVPGAVFAPLNLSEVPLSVLGLTGRMPVGVRLMRVQQTRERDTKE